MFSSYISQSRIALNCSPYVLFHLVDRKNRLTKSLNGFSTQEEIVSKIQQLSTSIDVGLCLLLVSYLYVHQSIYLVLSFHWTQENSETKQSLLKQLSENVERSVREEVEDNIKFCEDSIKNLTSELSALQGFFLELFHSTNYIHIVLRRRE